MVELNNQEYEDLVNKLKELKKKTLNKVVPFGKYKGKTLQEIYRLDRFYLYWLIRESMMKINPELIGLELPTSHRVLKILNLKYSDGEFVRTIVHPAVYDNWDLGHYGCSRPICIKEETRETYKYTFDDVLNTTHLEELDNHYPYIKWTKEYFESLFRTKN